MPLFSLDMSFIGAIFNSVLRLLFVIPVPLAPLILLNGRFLSGRPETIIL